MFEQLFYKDKIKAIWKHKTKAQQYEGNIKHKWNARSTQIADGTLSTPIKIKQHKIVQISDPHFYLSSAQHSEDTDS